MIGIKVTDLQGRRISFARATDRHLGRVISALTAFGYVMVRLTENNQALHDKLTGCLVVVDRQVGSVDGPAETTI